MSYDFALEPMQDSFVVIFETITVVILSCIHYPIIYAFYRRRNLPFFIQRGFWTTFVFVFAAFIGPHCITIGFILFNAPCYLWGLTDFGIAWMFTSSAERGFLLYVHFNLGVQAKHYIQNLNAEKSDKGWILKHRAWFHHGLFSITKFISLVSAILLSIPGWTKISGFPSSYISAPFWSVECRNIAVSTLWTISFLLLSISFACLLGMFFLRNVEDNLWIKLELTIKTMAFFGFSGMIFLLLNVSIYNQVERPLFLILQEPLFGFTAVVFVTMGLIVILYERRQRSLLEHGAFSSAKGSQDDILGVNAQATSELSPLPSSKISYLRVLEMILENDSAFRSLENFLLKELSIENLLFVRAVQNLQSMTLSQDDVMSTARQIYLKFISSYADLEVNISGECRASLESAFNNTPPGEGGKDQGLEIKNMTEALEKSKKEVMHLISNDSLRRFCRTDEFRTLGVSLIA
jgi:hypothetical protein